MRLQPPETLAPGWFWTSGFTPPHFQFLGCCHLLLHVSFQALGALGGGRGGRGWGGGWEAGTLNKPRPLPRQWPEASSLQDPHSHTQSKSRGPAPARHCPLVENRKTDHKAPAVIPGMGAGLTPVGDLESR